MLKLEQGKFYVGVTSKTPEERMREHQNGFLAAGWTKRYKPVELFDKKDLGLTTYEEAELFEGKVTRKYMDKYGLNNVRGGDLAVDEDYRRIFKWMAPKSVWSDIGQMLFILFVILFFATLYYIEKYS